MFFFSFTEFSLFQKRRATEIAIKEGAQDGEQDEEQDEEQDGKQDGE